jgi:AcrR family transcriptional regulator
MARDEDMEQVIFDAACKVFVEKGPTNARIADIADEAGITPSLLHYYFRKREPLFNKVFGSELRRIFPEQQAVLLSDRPVEEKVRTFAHAALEHHRANPHLAAFVAFEAHYNPNRITSAINEVTGPLDLSVLQQQIDAGVAEGRYRPTDACHLVADLLALCLFPFIAAPLIKLFMDLDDEAFEAFLDTRFETVPETILAGLRVEG